MGHCKTMMRRKSGEILSSSSGSTVATTTSGCSGRGCYPSNGTRTSKSYHRPHHHHHHHFTPNFQGPQQYFNNGSGYFDQGFPPPHPPPPPCGCGCGFIPQPQQPPQPLQHFPCENGPYNLPLPPLPPTPNLHRPLVEPPPRRWLQLGHSKHKRTSFTVLCYNILCARYATDKSYFYCPPWALHWNYRRMAILYELKHYSPDIITLQEMETDQFYNFFLPHLQGLGYSGIFGAKTRAKNLVESKRKYVDGCAIFYRTNKFKLLSEHLIEFDQVAMACAQTMKEEEVQNCYELLNRVQTKDNIALVALLETKVEAGEVIGLREMVTPRPKPLLVCTCHLHWDPEFCDVKLVQTMMLMKELRKISDAFDKPIHTSTETPPPEAKVSISTSISTPQIPLEKKRSGSSSSSSTSSSSLSSKTSGHSHSHKSKSLNFSEKLNFLICGDFNSLPYSGAIQFVANRKISNVHPDFRGLNYDGYLGRPMPSSTSSEKSSSDSDSESEYRHDFDLKSAYPTESMPFTNFTLDFQGVIDYIFHSNETLRPLGLLGPLDTSWLVQNNVVGAPNPYIPSDHLPLLVELEMVPAI